MASHLQKLLRKTNRPGIITGLKLNINDPAPSIFSALHPSFQPHLSDEPTTNRTNPYCNLIPTILDSPNTDNPNLSHPPPIFPSFSCGFFLNPMPSPGLLPSGTEYSGSGGSPTIWADSVKKKRKRKMNKHKLRKLRKRMRRKS